MNHSMAGWMDLLNPQLYFLEFYAFSPSIIVEEKGLIFCLLGTEKNIYCLSFWFKFPFILSVNLEKYSHFIKLIQIESK